MRDPNDKNKIPLSITTLNTYLINSLLIIFPLIKYFLYLFFSLLIKSFFPFSLSLLSLYFHFLCNFSYISTFLVFFSLSITFLISVLQNVQAKIFMAGAANGIRQPNEEREWDYKNSNKSSLNITSSQIYVSVCLSLIICLAN